jgi:glutathione synthase/RimK-type ligase-like ATP-grasp enzyme
MIVLWGPGADPTLDSVRAALDALNAPYVLADLGRPHELALDVAFDEMLRGALRSRALEVPLTDVDAIYLRPYRAVDAAADGALAHASRVDQACEAWLELTAALVVNRPGAAYSLTAKPHQARVIEAAGFAVPDTLVTTDPAAAEAFADQHPAVVFKSLSATRSIVCELDAEHRRRLADVVSAPVQFQERVEGVDVRVHVVGGDVHACEVRSTAVDYRYPGSTPPMLTPCSIPDDVAARCVRLTADLGLTLAGIDLRRTSSGRWYCFEANTSPAFSFYDRADGTPIATSLARLLASAARRELAA